MVFLVTQFPKPIITEDWEDLPPVRLSGARPAAKGAWRLAGQLLGEGTVVKGMRSAPSPLNDTNGLLPTHIFCTDFLS